MTEALVGVLICPDGTKERPLAKRVPKEQHSKELDFRSEINKWADVVHTYESCSDDLFVCDNPSRYLLYVFVSLI